MTNNAGFWIELTEQEQALAKYMAKSRAKNARGSGMKDRKFGGQSGDEGDLNGYGAELAFCKLTNCYPDMKTGQKQDDADVIYRTGHRIDVKSTPYKTGYLITPADKHYDGVDLFALMIGEFPRYRLAGFMSRDELVKPERVSPKFKNTAFAANQEELDLLESARNEPLVQSFIDVFKGSLIGVKKGES